MPERLRLATLLLGLAALAAPASAPAQESFNLELEGRRVEIPIRRIGGVRYVTLADLARGFGGRVEWLEVGERAAAVFLGERVVFRRGVPFVEAGGELHQVPHAPRFEGGELYVPFSFIQQGLPAIFPERFDFQPETSSLRQAPPGGDLEGIEYLVAPGLTTLRFFFGGAVPPRLAADNSLPHTLVLRVEGEGAGAVARGGFAGLGLVDSLRVERDPQGAERFVFFLDEEAFLYQVARLAEPAGFEVTLYSPAAGVSAEEVLARGATPSPGELLPPPPLRREGEAAARPAAGARPPAVETPLATGPPAAREERTGIRTVVIDAGHGGRDVGAVGPNGVLEKDVTLQVARALRAELESRSDLEVILSRERDVFVPLTARTRLANESGADLFISVHCNSSRGRSGAGFETYFLSEAKTEDERRVAKMENASLRFENPEIDPEQLGELNFILWDLAQNEYLRESSFLAELVQRGLADEIDLRNRGVKQAGFWVLNGAYMPAILVEMAFLSNPSEESLLASEDFQGRIVDGLADSVMGYVDMYERKVTLQEVGA
jgi:N-acetylmuramoyl-L-alanine amidase